MGAPFMRTPGPDLHFCDCCRLHAVPISELFYRLHTRATWLTKAGNHMNSLLTPANPG
jgi:hypothetical protein